MAKQYIPKISGLLTEPNPVDAPSNSLSEAENVIIDQNGKVQARHGLNVNQDEASSPFAASYSEAFNSNGQIIPSITSTDYDSLTNYIYYSSFFIPDQINTGESFYKLIEFKKSDDTIVSGLFIKQRRNEYKTVTSGTNISYIYKNETVTDKVIRAYQISANSGKLINLQELPYSEINNIFNTNSSLYFNTEDGLTEANVDRVFNWEGRDPYFTIRWPAFPKITHTFNRSAIYLNWLGSSEKFAIRLTIFREMGYTDKEGEIYESQPSPIYEIVNIGKETIPTVYFDFLTNLQTYETWNNFSKLTNGRKFGIKIYRTISVPIEENLPTEFFECYDSIYFDNALSGYLTPSDSPTDNFQWFRFSNNIEVGNAYNSGAQSLNINDIMSYVIEIPSYYSGLLKAAYAKNKTMFYGSLSEPFLATDYIPLRLKVTNYRKYLTYNEYQFTALSDSNDNNRSAYLLKDAILSRRLKTKITATSGSPNLKFNDLRYNNVYHSYDISGTGSFNSLSTITFINTAPPNFTAGTAYHVVYNTGDNIRLSTTIGGTAINVGAGWQNDISEREIEIHRHPYVDNAYLIKSFQIELNINNDSLVDTGSRLYTDKNLDSEYYTNFIAPKSKYIIPYKDFYLYASTQKPLEAKLTVIKQPTIEQHICVPAITNTFYTSRTITFVGPPSATPTFTSSNIGLTNGNAVYFSTTPPAPFVINTYYYVVDAASYPGSTFKLAATLNGTAITPTASGTATMVYQRWTSANASLFSLYNYGFYTKSNTNLLTGITTDSRLNNGELYIESAITGYRRYSINRFPSSSLLSNLLNYNTIEFSSSLDDISSNIVNFASSDSNIDHAYLSNNINFGATIFERPYLQMNLVDMNGISKVLTIQTEPIYNRNGYYSLKNQNDEFDYDFLTYDLSFEEMNSFRKTTNTDVIRRGLDNIYHVVGEKEGQVSADGIFPGEIISVSTNEGIFTTTCISGTVDISIGTIDSYLAVNDKIKFTATAPTGFTVGTTYYVVYKVGTLIRLSASLGGGAITPTSTGLHSITTIDSVRFSLSYSTIANGDIIQFTNTAPTGFSLNTNYYAISSFTNEFSLSATLNGTRIVPNIGTFSIKSGMSTKYLSKWINDSTGDVYYNKDANTLLIKNTGNMDIKKFESPGIIMIQSNQTDFILFTYSSIDTSSSISNAYTFKSVSVQYINRNKYPSTITGASTYADYFIYDPNNLNNEIVSNPRYFRISGPTYFFFLQGSTVDGLVLYPYSKDIRISKDTSIQDLTPTGIDIQIRSDKTTISEYYTPTDLTATSPTFTLLPHRKMSQTPVGFFQKSKNHTFAGINSKDAGPYLDLYASQIISKFNIELKKSLINAYLIKGEGIGEIKIIYPDGKSIELFNGMNAGGYYPGNHVFFPEIGKLTWTTVASRDLNDSLYDDNEIIVSRRNIPEITPLGSFLRIGKNDKKFIGYASNVDDLYLFKEDGIFRITDRGNISTNIPNLQVSQFTTNVVCQAAGSIQEINEEIIFLSQYGFMSITNGGIENISKDIQRDILTLIQTSPKDRIKSFVNESKQLYYCTLINEVDASLNVKSGTYIFNTKTRQWSFMDQEILDGLEDSNKRNLVMYRQKAIVGNTLNTSSWNANGKTHQLTSATLSYPLQTTNHINNFYYISRERHTNNISVNPIDQYDYISENLLNGTLVQLSNGFSITTETSQNAFIYHYAQKIFKMFTPINTIYNSNTNTQTIVDSPIQMFIGRQIYIEVQRTGQSSNEYYEVKLSKFEYTGTTLYSIKYTFEYLSTNIPPNFTGITSIKAIVGIPVKIEFNPESGNQPDTNKLFQEYMIHTETNNKGAMLSFKTDSRTNLTTDRRFVYDPTATNRNIFRTYIPTNAARGRYLIRQVKHDVPLENLIITGQTIVMRDSGSTRVQKDKDTN